MEQTGETTLRRQRNPVWTHNPRLRPRQKCEKEAADILEAQLKLFQQTKKRVGKLPTWPRRALQKHMKAVRSAYTAFNKYPYRIKFEYRGKLNTPAVSSGSIALACDVAVKALETGSYFARDPEKGKVVVKEQADLLSHCLQTVCSFTDTSPKARKAVVEHGRLMPLLVKKLDEWYQPHIDGTRLVSTYRLRYVRSHQQSSETVWKSKWPSWAPVPNKPTVSLDVKQHFNQTPISILVSRFGLAVRR